MLRSVSQHAATIRRCLRRPSGVDVSSGVCGPDKLRKDHESVRNYVRNARAALS